MIQEEFVSRWSLLELFQIHFSILAGLLTERNGGPSPEAWAGAQRYIPLLGFRGDLILL